MGRVFLVHGRHVGAVNAVRALLSAAKVDVLDWEAARKETPDRPAFTWDIVRTALSQSSAILVLVTGDEWCFLKPGLRERGDDWTEMRPRPNVLIELGAALMTRAADVVLVVFGKGVGIGTDLGGLNYLSAHPDVAFRRTLLLALEEKGCQPDLSTSAWETAGDFAGAIRASMHRPIMHFTVAAILSFLAYTPSLLFLGRDVAGWVLQVALALLPAVVGWLAWGTRSHLPDGILALLATAWAGIVGMACSVLLALNASHPTDFSAHVSPLQPRVWIAMLLPAIACILARHAADRSVRRRQV